MLFRSVTGDHGPGPTDPLIEQAHRDLQQGQVDTDLRNTPGLDAARREQLVPGAGGRASATQRLAAAAVPGTAPGGVAPDRPDDIDPADGEDGSAPPHPQPAISG